MQYKVNTPAYYVDIVKLTCGRSILANKVRVSAHNLTTGKGRYSNILRQKRLCLACKLRNIYCCTGLPTNHQGDCGGILMPTNHQANGRRILEELSYIVYFQIYPVTALRVTHCNVIVY